MKNNLIPIILTMILFCNYISQAQEEFIQSKNVISIGTKFGEIGKGLQFDNALPVEYLPDDIAIDLDGNFLICDKFSKKIIKYDKYLNPIIEIQIQDENFGNYIKVENKYRLSSLYYDVDIEVDALQNIYVLVSNNNYFYRFLKFNSQGVLDQSFKIEESLKGIRTNLFYLFDKRIFIITTPANFFDDEYKKNGSVFVFDLAGDFLGRGDYFWQDNKGNIYKKNNFKNKNKLWLDQYINDQGGVDLFVSDLKFNKSLYVDLTENTALRFIGIDSLGRLYFIDKGLNGVEGKIFDFNNYKVIDINIAPDYFKQLTNRYIFPHNPFILSPSGDIYLLAIQTKGRDNKWDKVKDYYSVAITLIKMK